MPGSDTAQSFTVNGVEIPPELKASLDRYANERIETGSFLRAILENDLQQTVGRADDRNITLLPVLVSYVYNELPAPCWGNPAKVAAWLAERKTKAEGGVI